MIRIQIHWILIRIEAFCGIRIRIVTKVFLKRNWKYLQLAKLLSKNFFTYVFSNPWKTSRIQEKPSALERVIQTLNVVIFFPFLRNIFACLIRNWIWVPYPISNPLSQIWIQIQNPNPSNYTIFTESLFRSPERIYFYNSVCYFQAMWTAYCIIVMAIYWIFECVPLAITALIPVVLLPLTGNILLQITNYKVENSANQSKHRILCPPNQDTTHLAYSIIRIAYLDIYACIRANV